MKPQRSTKNLINTFKKQLNLALNHIIKQKPFYHQYLKIKQQIKQCTSINTLQNLLKQHKDLRSSLQTLMETGQLLSSLLRGKYQYCNIALSLKYYNIFLNIIKHPYFKELTWTSQIKLQNPNKNEPTSTLKNNQSLNNQAQQQEPEQNGVIQVNGRMQAVSGQLALTRKPDVLVESLNDQPLQFQNVYDEFYHDSMF